MSNGSYPAFQATIERIRSALGERGADWAEICSPEDFRAVELEAAAFGRELADAITEDVLRGKLRDGGFQALAVASALRGGRPMRRDGIKEVPVTLLGGRTIRVRVQYLKPDHRSRPGPRRKPGKHGKTGVGLLPALQALGVCWGVTPALGAEVARQVAASESFRPALEALKSRGIDLGYKRTHRLATNIGKQAVELRNQWVEKVHEGKARRSNLLAGKRVVLTTDGGRVRLRVPKRRGRRRKSGHRGFDTPWREPKLFVIYVLNEKGEMEARFRPVYDGTMGDCNAVYRLLTAYLKALGAEQADQLIILGDGAKWIWERVPALVTDLGIDPDRIVEVLDWYHAVETLAEIAAMPANSRPNERKRWLKRAKDLLWRGDIDRLLAHIDALADAHGAPEASRRASYFEDNAHRMRYQAFDRAAVPIGSGAAESAIRRVLNLRMKGSSKFWLEDSAEGMILMRGYLKTGRFDDLVAWSYTASIPWWEDIAYQDPLGLDAVGVPQAVPLAA